MADENHIETELFTRCRNEQCHSLIRESELKQNDGKCPHCGEQIWETD
jgi:hypothetical protein